MKRRPEELTPAERRTVSLAIGRILRMGSRPGQPGDIEEYYRCRGIVLDIVEGTVEERLREEIDI